jgi:hypothetical protein
MARREYSHLVKPLRVRETSPGFYGKRARVWMEGEDLERFNAHFRQESG